MSRGTATALPIPIRSALDALEALVLHFPGDRATATVVDAQEFDLVLGPDAILAELWSKPGSKGRRGGYGNGLGARNCQPEVLFKHANHIIDGAGELLDDVIL